ncbi:MAG: putative membrane protein [Urechidicola sp.]
MIMGQKLFRFSSVMAVLALALGIWLWLGYGFSGGWLHAKLGFVGLLLAYHGQSYRYIQQMARDETIRTSLFFRIYNELALFIVIPILILVIVKPF